MTLGQKLLELRKAKHLSQEEVAFKLNVTRQTISKWETDQSTPDFDRIAPLCLLYEITPNELIGGFKEEKKQAETNSMQEELIFEETLKEEDRKRKMAKGISLGVFLYFVAVVWIVLVSGFMDDDAGFAPAIFLLICGVATFIIIYTCMMHHKEDKKEEKVEDPLLKQIKEVVSIVTLIVYLILSFITMAWHITWILWVIYSLIIEIIKLIFIVRSDTYEE